MKNILCIGNAITDIIQPINDDFLAQQKIEKNVMQLIDAKRSAQLAELCSSPKVKSGGSVANSAFAITKLGGKASFMGTVCDDVYGHKYKQELESIGVDFVSPITKTELPTSCSIIFISPDGARSMNTYLGASCAFNEASINWQAVEQADIIYIEGYLWDQESAKDAIKKIIIKAKELDKQIAFSLSDPFCVDRHKVDFINLVQLVDIVFANENEITALYTTYDAQAIKDILLPKTVCITRGENGSNIIHPDGIENINAEPIDRLVDTTGAGDAYAGGFLYAYSSGANMADCGKQASACAAQVIQKIGGRI